MSTLETKPKMVVFAPIATRSGYGDMGRDIVRHFIEYDKFDVSIISAPWGDTPMTALNAENPKDKMLLDRIITNQLTAQPEVFVHIGIPSEARPIGKYNILCTAGIETTISSAQWIEACNRMDLVLTISEHSKRVFENSKYGFRNANGTEGTLELTKPIEVLHNCIDTKVFGKNAPQDAGMVSTLDTIPADFSLEAGELIFVDFPEQSSKPNPEYNKRMSGVYMISALCHKITTGKADWQAITSLELVRDSYGRKV